MYLNVSSVDFKKYKRNLEIQRTSYIYVAYKTVGLLSSENRTPEEGYFTELFNCSQNCIANATSVDGGGGAHFIFNIHSAACSDVFLAGQISLKK